MAGPVEIERKYALAADQELPSLAGVVLEGPVAEHHLVATYYDTPDFRLTRARQVVRHRTGGTDAGWHLKLPGESADVRYEVHAPSDSPRVPPALRAQVADTLAGAPLFPVAVLRTHRREQQLLGTDGTLLALACTDRVRSTAGGQDQEWSEAEVELAGGDTGLADRIEAGLAAAGVHRATTGSKIARALADAMAAAPEVVGPHSSAAAVVLAYVAEQVGVLQSRESDVRLDGPEAVHRSRVATRRLRSTLRSYGEVFAPSGVAALRTELRWHAEELGAPRDAEVLAERLMNAVESLPVAARAEVENTLATALGRTHSEAHAALVASMGTVRYSDLHLALEQVLARPALAQPELAVAASAPASATLAPMLERVIARVRKLAEHAASRPTDLTRWHEVRKAAKAARYGAEVLLPVLPERAEHLRANWERVTEAFGAVQDAVVAQQLIGELSWQAVAAGQSRQPYDDLRHDQDEVLRESLTRGRKALAVALAVSLG